LSQRGDHALAAPLRRSQVNEEHLVVAMVNQLPQRMPAFRKINRRELALEDRVLQVVAKITHGLEDLPQPLVVADVVADEVSVTHAGYVLLGGIRQCSSMHAVNRPRPK